MTVTTMGYLRLADELEAGLADLGSGARLPSEHELAATHGVSRITTRAALQELEQRHVVRRTRGSGTYVALRLPYPLKAGMAPSWSQTVRSHGHVPSYEVLAIDSMRAPAPVAHALLLPRGRAVKQVRRVGLVNGDVAVHQTIWLPASRVPDLDVHLERHRSLSTTLIEGYAITPTRWWSQAELTAVPAPIGSLLELTGRPPAWQIESVNTCVEQGKPIELNQAWMRADCFRVRLELGPLNGAGSALTSLPDLTTTA